MYVPSNVGQIPQAIQLAANGQITPTVPIFDNVEMLKRALEVNSILAQLQPYGLNLLVSEFFACQRASD